MIVTRNELYVGLNDKNTYKNIDNFDNVKNKIGEYLINSKIGFSINKLLGGYIHKSGKYVIENSLRITLIGFLEENELIKLVNYLKEEYNQESILVTTSKTNLDYIKEGELNEI